MKQFVNVLLAGVLGVGAVLSLASAANAWEYLFDKFGAGPGDHFGSYIAGLGDINEDGFDDILVVRTGLERAEIYWGGNPMSKRAIWSVHAIGAWVMGDLNHDGILDFRIERGLFWGGSYDTVPNQTLPFTPYRAGDINGDGYDDVWGFVYNINDGRGGLRLHLGSADGVDTIPDWDRDGQVNNEDMMLYNYSSMGGGLPFDFNGDGYSDFCISGSIRDSVYRGDDRYIDFYFGGPDLNYQPARHWELTSQNGMSFQMVDTLRLTGFYPIGDMNGDGCDELLLDLVGHDNPAGGKFWATPIMLGRADIDTFYIDVNLKPGGTQCSVGDVNGDGYGDLVTTDSDEYWGRLYLYLGGRWMDGNPAMSIGGAERENMWGFGRVSYCGDVNGDGLDDIAFEEGGEHEEGRVCIIAGSDEWRARVGNEGDNAASPSSYKIVSVAPNPFNDQLNIKFQVAGFFTGTLAVCNVNGSRVAELFDGELGTGDHEFAWDPDQTPSGIYLVVGASAGHTSEVRKVVHLR